MAGSKSPDETRRRYTTVENLFSERGASPRVARHPTEDGNEDAGSCDLGFNPLPPVLIPSSVSVVHRQTTSRNLLKQTFPEIHIRRRSSSSRHPWTSAAPPSVILEPNIRVFHPPTGQNLAMLATCPAYTAQGQLLLDFPSWSRFLISRLDSPFLSRGFWWNFPRSRGSSGSSEGYVYPVDERRRPRQLFLIYSRNSWDSSIWADFGLAFGWLQFPKIEQSLVFCGNRLLRSNSSISVAFKFYQNWITSSFKTRLTNGCSSAVLTWKIGKRSIQALSSLNHNKILCDERLTHKPHEAINFGNLWACTWHVP